MRGTDSFTETQMDAGAVRNRGAGTNVQSVGTGRLVFFADSASSAVKKPFSVA